MSSMFNVAEVLTIPREQMEFWNSTSVTASVVLASLTGLAVIILCALAVYNKDAKITAYIPLALMYGVGAFVLLVGIPYVFANTAYMKEGSVQSLTDLGYQNVSMDGIEAFTATKDGRYITGALADTPDEDAYFVIELSAVTVE